MNEKKINRRKFVGNIGALGFAAAAYPWIDSLGKKSDKAPVTDKVKLGIIGTGVRGKALLLHLMEIEEAEIIAFCDDYPPNYEWTAQRLLNTNAKGYVDYRKLLELSELDAVVIATPLHEHARMTIEAMDAGKHVFCEKAMAKTLEDCAAMRDAALEKKKLLQIGHQRLFHPQFIKAVKMIHEGFAGGITQMKAYWHRNNDWRRPVPRPSLERKINWRLYNEYSLGLMTELASHHLQLANWIMNEPPVEVMGSGGINYWKDGREVPDNVNLVYKYANGTHLMYDSLISNKHYGLEFQAMGNKGAIELESGNFYSENPPPTPGIIQLINDIENNVFDLIPIGGASWVPETAEKTKPEKIYNIRQNVDFEVKLQMQSFAHFVKHNELRRDLLREGYNASVATLLGDTAMKENRIVRIPLDLYM